MGNDNKGHHRVHRAGRVLGEPGLFDRQPFWGFGLSAGSSSCRALNPTP